MAERFQTSDSFTGYVKGFRSGRVNWVNYNSILTIGVSAQGLYLKVMWIFSLGSPPLLIPWTAVTKIRRKNYLFYKGALLDIGSPSIARIMIPWQFVEDAAAWIPVKPS